MRTIQVDVAIAGGGIAGLWIANVLLTRGLDVAVCDPGGVAGAQTPASQGLIHGGIKYALGGHAGGAFDALREMPERWRRCLRGEGELDLRGVAVVAEACHLWSRKTLAARLAGFLGSRLMHGRAVRLAPRDYPAPFAGQSGDLYRLDDFALDVAGLCRHLEARLGDRLLRTRVTPGAVVRRDGRVAGFRTGDAVIEAEHVVLAAGAGNAELARAAGVTTQMQTRPLKQVLVHHPSPEPLFVHCIAGLAPEPALTVSTRPGHHYVGGALASDGASRSDDDQIGAARRALHASLPWIDWDTRRFETLSINRAEPAQQAGQRPNEAFVAAHENALLVWPVKLALAPDVGDRVLRALAA